MIARTGYSGEDGFEVYLPADEPTTVKVWNELLAAGEEFGIRPCGLGARNTLRLEAGMSLYGHEISDDHQCLRSRTRPLAQARQGRVHRPPGSARRPVRRRRPSANSSLLRWSIAASRATGTPCFAISKASRSARSHPARPHPSSRPTSLSRLCPAFAESKEDVLVQIRPTQTARAKQVPLPFYKRPKA